MARIHVLLKYKSIFTIELLSRLHLLHDRIMYMLTKFKGAQCEPHKCRRGHQVSTANR